MLKAAIRTIRRVAVAISQGLAAPNLDWQRHSRNSMKAAVAKTLACPHPLTDTAISPHNPYGLRRYCPHDPWAHRHRSEIIIQARDDEAAEWRITGPDGFASETVPDIETTKSIAECRAREWRERPEPSHPVSPAEAEILRQTHRP